MSGPDSARDLPGDGNRVASMIERAPFGRTGHDSSRVIFGSAGIARADQETADRLLPLLLEHGVNHIDTAAMYGDAELRLAPWLQEHPGEFFLATKTHARDGDGARSSLERSLTRLGVDHVDLIQLHNLVEPDEWDVAHAPGGALEALLKARDEGLTRFIGVTGHGLRIAGMHLRSLERFDYDSVLLPYNFTLLQDSGYRSDVEQLLALCADRNVAVQTIKSIARRRWSEPKAPGEKRQSWYEPLTDADAIARVVRFVLDKPQLFIDSSSAIDQLAHVLTAAESALPADEAKLTDDVSSFDMAPLFDGAELERICRQTRSRPQSSASRAAPGPATVPRRSSTADTSGESACSGATRAGLMATELAQPLMSGSALKEEVARKPITFMRAHSAIELP